mgnify:CR=1 FL=1
MVCSATYLRLRCGLLSLPGWSSISLAWSLFITVHSTYYILYCDGALHGLWQQLPPFPGPHTVLVPQQTRDSGVQVRPYSHPLTATAFMDLYNCNVVIVVHMFRVIGSQSGSEVHIYTMPSYLLTTELKLLPASDAYAGLTNSYAP